MNVGWFPRYNPDGTRLTWERPDYFRPCWLTDTVEIAHNGVNLVIGGQVTAFPGGNELAAGGGIWAVFRPDPVRVITSTGRTIDGAGVPVVNPDGLWGYVHPYNADSKKLIFNGGTVDIGAITDVRASRQAIVWSDAGRTHGVTLAAPAFPADIQAAPAEFRPIPIDTPNGPWVGNHTHTGLVVRPFGATDGYRFDNGGQCFYPDWTYRDGAIVAIFTNDRGEQSEHAFPLDAPRVELGATAPVPPVIDFPPQFPTEPPPMAYEPQAPDITALIRELAQQHPAEWADAYEWEGHPRTDAFVRLVAAAAFARDPRFGLNGKRGTDTLSLDVLAFKNPTVPESCGGVELRDFVFDDGRPGSGRHDIVWGDATIVPGMREDLPNGVPGKWIQPGNVTAPGPTPTGNTHRYVGGGNDTGACDQCGQPRVSNVHRVPEGLVQGHTPWLGEDGKGDCDLCMQPVSAPIHGAVAPGPNPSPDLAARVMALETDVAALRSGHNGLINAVNALRTALEEAEARLGARIATGAAMDPAALRAAVEGILAGYEAFGSTGRAGILPHSHENVRLALRRKT